MPRFWRVEPGDTLFLIASVTETTVEQLLRLNPEVVPENLEIGSLIRLPEILGLPLGPIPPCESGFFWVVAPGDTLHVIALEVGTTVDRLLELNPEIDPLNLTTGQSVCLPFQPGQPPPENPQFTP